MAVGGGAQRLNVRAIRSAAIAAGLALLLTACAGQQILSLHETPVAALPGWRQDHQSRDLRALLRDCERLSLLPPEQKLGGQGIAASLGGKAGSWSGACADARRVAAGDDAARAFFEREFAAYQISDRGRATVLFTGYYEPEVRGSTERGGIYQTPIYGLPADIVQFDLGAFAPELAGRRGAGRVVNSKLLPYPDRAQIESGALAGQELLWLADPVDAYFLQIQGAGRVMLPDGSVRRVAYAGQNGKPYTPIGKILVDQGQLPADQVSMQTIRAWLAAHPDKAGQIMAQNQDFVFFREVRDLSPMDGPPGALGVSLTPGRSLAVDRNFIPLAAPVWVSTTEPITRQPWRKLAQAEDLGAAIKGPLRADLFFGWGPQSAAQAGHAHESGAAYVLLPRPQTTPKTR